MTDELIEEVAKVTEVIVSDTCTVPETQAAVAKLANLLAAASTIDFKDPQQAVGNNNTDNGTALSPLLAAGCAFNHIRTQQFQRGVHQYLKEAKDGDQPLQILYAGTGPYATLLFPVLLLHRHRSIEVSVIDIYKSSTNGVLKLFELAQFKNIAVTAYTSDATKWRPKSSDEQFDLIISETMDRGLMREPQVSIFKHLCQFLKPEGQFIPEEITISATLLRNNEISELGTIFTLNKSTSQQLSAEDKPYFDGNILLGNDDNKTFTQLVISTEVHTYGEHHLRRNEIEITTDFSYRYLDLTQERAIPYRYSMEENPGFTFTLPFYQAPLPPENLAIETQSGTPYLYVFWHNVLWDFHRPRRNEEHKSLQTWLKWDNVLTMIDAYKADLQSSIEQVLAVHPPCFSRFETWFLDTYGRLSNQELKALNQTIAISHM